MLHDQQFGGTIPLRSKFPTFKSALLWKRLAFASSEPHVGFKTFNDLRASCIHITLTMMLQSRDSTKAPVSTSPRSLLRRFYRTSKRSPSPSPPPSPPMSTSPLSIPRSTSPASTSSSTESGVDRSQQIRTSTGPFYRARHFVVNNPVFQQYIQNEAYLNPSECFAFLALTLLTGLFSIRATCSTHHARSKL